MNFKNTNSKKWFELGQMYQISLLCMAVILLVPWHSDAQTNELSRHYIDTNISLQAPSISSKSSSKPAAEIITEEGATWLRLYFKDVNLGANSTLTITSNLDGAQQVLTTATLKQWKNTSAYFNGDSVTITLNTAAGDSDVRATVAELGVGDPPKQVRSQCGSRDDRVDANDAAIGRIVPIGCTGWIITNGRLVTAGHCGGSRAQIVEFNVPKSNPDRTIVHPGPEDQYPIGNFVTQFVRGRPETDWAVFTAGANTQTGLTPIQAQGKSYNVVRQAPGDRITITGFGSDTGIDNQTQQIHTGPTSSVDNTFVRYRTDTTGGNSGSPIIDTETGNAVGVHAYGGCSGSGGSNFGERATIPAFWEAMGLGSGNPPPPPVSDTCSGDIDVYPYTQSFEGTLGQWSQSTNDAINWTVTSGGTPSDGTGPSSAVSGSSYIYVEASGDGTGFPNKSAILNSPCLDFSGVTAPTLSFEYHMQGNAVGVLSVEVRTNNTGDWQSLFTRSQAQGNQWNTATIDMTSYAGNPSVQLRLNAVTGSGWQGDIAVDAFQISGSGAPTPACQALDFNNFQLNSFSNQDADNNATVSNGGTTLVMNNNTWKYIPLSYNITANTVIEFTFSSTSEGEIHGLGFEDDNSLTPGNYFKVYGTQDYGVTNFDTYSGGTQTFVIPVGNFYTGAADRLVFINDNDAGGPANSVFTNVKIYEGSCGEAVYTESVVNETPIEAILGKEAEQDITTFTIAPNPASNAFTVSILGNMTNATASIYNMLGQVKATLPLNEGANIISIDEYKLAKGVYLITVKSETITMTQRLIIK